MRIGVRGLSVGRSRGQTHRQPPLFLWHLFCETGMRAFPEDCSGHERGSSICTGQPGPRLSVTKYKNVANNRKVHIRGVFPSPSPCGRACACGELPDGTLPACCPLPAPHLARSLIRSRAQAELVEGKQAGRINQISVVSQMIRFCTCFPDTH